MSEWVVWNGWGEGFFQCWGWEVKRKVHTGKYLIIIDWLQTTYLSLTYWWAQNCCSKSWIAAHYTSPLQMNAFHYQVQSGCEAGGVLSVVGVEEDKGVSWLAALLEEITIRGQALYAWIGDWAWSWKIFHTWEDSTMCLRMVVNNNTTTVLIYCRLLASILLFTFFLFSTTTMKYHEQFNILLNIELGGEIHCRMPMLDSI